MARGALLAASGGKVLESHGVTHEVILKALEADVDGKTGEIVFHPLRLETAVL